MKRVLEHVRRQRWIYLGVVIAVSAFLVWAIQIQGWRISHPARDVVYAIGLANLLVVLWIYVVSGFQPRMRQSAIIFWGVLQLIPLMSLRVDGFDGNARPIMKWRWTPSAEENFLPPNEANTANVAGEIQMPLNGDDDSPCYRGNDRDGHNSVEGLVTHWKTQRPRELWRRPVGLGWSSFAVIGPMCITQEQRGDKESVVCYELTTGRELWAHHDACRFDEATSGSGPRATPSVYDGRVYTLGGTGVLNCLDGSSGKVVWTVATTEQGDEAMLFGASSSPLIVDDMVVVAARGNAGWLSAFDRETGEPIWSAATDVGSHSSPQLVEIPGGDSRISRFIVNFDNANLRAFALDGSELWNVPYGENNKQFVNVSQPVIVEAGSEGLADIVVSAGYGRGTSRFRLHGSDRGMVIDELWHSSKLGTKFSSVMVHDGYIYGLNDGILTCVKLADGKRQWKRGRYGHGQMIMVNDVFLIQAEDGDIALVAADPEKHRELVRISALGDRTWNTPVVSGRHLLIRNDREAVCYELPVD